MIHQCQGLALSLEARDDRPSIESGLDDLQSDVAAKRLRLLGHEDKPHPAFADLLKQFVGTDGCTDVLRNFERLVRYDEITNR
jgi:hypothetical protein